MMLMLDEELFWGPHTRSKSSGHSQLKSEAEFSPSITNVTLNCSFKSTTLCV